MLQIVSNCFNFFQHLLRQSPYRSSIGCRVRLALCSPDTGVAVTRSTSKGARNLGGCRGGDPAKPNTEVTLAENHWNDGL